MTVKELMAELHVYNPSDIVTFPIFLGNSLAEPRMFAIVTHLTSKDGFVQLLNRPEEKYIPDCGKQDHDIRGD